MRLTIDEIIADNARMERYLCERIPPDGTRVDLGNGAWADQGPERYWLCNGCGGQYDQR